jgi:hypothetical protein
MGAKLGDNWGTIPVLVLKFLKKISQCKTQICCVALALLIP